MNETSRNQGWAIMGGAIFLGLLFLAGILQGSYWALALPIAVLVFFVLGLVAWVGHTIATVQVEAEPPAVEPAPEPESRSESAS
jgi:fatty acid desaturase